MLPTYIWPREFHGVTELDMTERPSLLLSSVPLAQVQWGCKADECASVCYLYFWSISELRGW